MRSSRFALALAAAIALASFAARDRATATPVFAQAYGLGCTACHAQVPVLNAFGRYIQRTGYAALSPQALKHALPVFLFDTGTTYTHQSGAPTRITGPLDRTILQANSALGPDVTYKIEQVVADAGAQARTLLREATALVILLALVLLGLPFAAGYFVGRARGARRREA